MFSHGNLREIMLFRRIFLYSNRYRQLAYGQTKEKIHRILPFSLCSADSHILQKCLGFDKIARTTNSNSSHYKLGRCDSDYSIWYSRSFAALPFFILKPKLRIENPRVNVSNEGYHSEFKDACFVIHNMGKRQARNIRIRAKPYYANIKLPCWGDFKTLNPNFPAEFEPFDLDPEQKVAIKLCQVRKGDRMVILHCEQGEMPALDVGQTYELLLRFTGRNFSDRKVWHLQLNLSYENLNLEISS